MKLDDFRRQMLDKCDKLSYAYENQEPEDQADMSYSDALDDIRDILTGFIGPEMQLTEEEDGLALYPDAVGYVYWECPECESDVWVANHCDGKNGTCECGGWRWCMQCEVFEMDAPSTDYEREGNV